MMVGVGVGGAIGIGCEMKGEYGGDAGDAYHLPSQRQSAAISRPSKDITPSESRTDDQVDGVSVRSVLPVALVVEGAIAAAWLAVTGVRLLIDIDGPGCHGEFPFCTTPTQQSARQVFAVVCGVGVLAYLLAAAPP